MAAGTGVNFRVPIGKLANKVLAGRRGSASRYLVYTQVDVEARPRAKKNMMHYSGFGARESVR